MQGQQNRLAGLRVRVQSLFFILEGALITLFVQHVEGIFIDFAFFGREHTKTRAKIGALLNKGKGALIRLSADFVDQAYEKW